MRKLLSTAIVLVCVALLSSCAVFFDNDQQQADAQMEKIAAAVNDHDPAALKALFSKRALKDATRIDEGVDHFLSFFPDGGLTWQRDTVNLDGHNERGRKTELLQAYYKVSVGGVDYLLFFADFTVNDVYDTDNVGIYGLGVIPWTDDVHSGTAEQFSWWASSIDKEKSNAVGYPGVWVGFDNRQMSLYKLHQIIIDVKFQDSVGLRDRFSEYVRTDYATEIDDELDKLVALFPDSNDVVEDQQAVPTVLESAEGGGETTLLLSTNRVISGESEYWLFLAYFPENAIDPSNIGIYAIGVAPWTEPGDSPAEKALLAWGGSFQVDASVPPEVFIAQ